MSTLSRMRQLLTSYDYGRVGLSNMTDLVRGYVDTALVRTLQAVLWKLSEEGRALAVQQARHRTTLAYVNQPIKVNYDHDGEG